MRLVQDAGANMRELDNRARKFPIEQALKIARQYEWFLMDYVERIQIVGSIRRQKPEVKDIELMYIPKFAPKKGADLFGDEWENLADVKLEGLCNAGILEKRVNKRGFHAWGPSNKLGRDLETGIPIDFFATTAPNWWNYLVCRTGGMESNIAICEAAQAKGWQWNPYGAGFYRGEGEEPLTVGSEREVFEAVGLPYKEPHERS